MTHKTNPHILRTPYIQAWPSRWFAAKKQYREALIQDYHIRHYLSEKLRNVGFSSLTIEKDSEKVKISIHTPKPGLIIGKGGAEIEKIRKEINERFLKKGENLEISVVEEKSSGLSANVILAEIIGNLEKRVSYRRTMKKAMNDIKTNGAIGCRIILSGRLDGAEIARTEKLSWGKLPLTTFRANIDYALGTAFTIFGAIGIKIWIYKGEIFLKKRV
jgi:small subunit ribosomal protein S3